MKVSELIYRDIPGTEDFEDVVSIELGSGYDWDSLEGWYSPSRRRFFWLDDGGCSCNYLGFDVYEIDGFESGTRDELASAVRRKYDNSFSSPKPSELIADLARVKAFQVKS